MTTLSARKHYRKRVRASSCRGKPASICKRTGNCKTAKRNKKSYCRYKKNTRRGHSRAHRTKTNKFELLANSSSK